MAHRLSILTLNLHKGFSSFPGKFILSTLRSALRDQQSDIVFLQEVVGAHRKHAARFSDWPTEGQFEYLADGVWDDYAYGKNASYPNGHHGNAVLSRFPIVSSHQQSLSAHALEQRGYLYAALHLPESDTQIHTLCVHLGLLQSWRKEQYRMLRTFIEQEIPHDAPLIVAGDFNDWRKQEREYFSGPLNLIDAHQAIHGSHAKTFPARAPIVSIDRIYLRHLTPYAADVLAAPPWSNLSDHLPVCAGVELP